MSSSTSSTDSGRTGSQTGSSSLSTHSPATAFNDAHHNPIFPSSSDISCLSHKVSSWREGVVQPQNPAVHNWVDVANHAYQLNHVSHLNCVAAQRSNSRSAAAELVQEDSRDGRGDDMPPHRRLHVARQDTGTDRTVKGDFVILSHTHGGLADGGAYETAAERQNQLEAPSIESAHELESSEASSTFIDSSCTESMLAYRLHSSEQPVLPPSASNPRSSLQSALSNPTPPFCLPPSVDPLSLLPLFLPPSGSPRVPSTLRTDVLTPTELSHLSSLIRVSFQYGLLFGLSGSQFATLIREGLDGLAVGRAKGGEETFDGAMEKAVGRLIFWTSNVGLGGGSA